MSSGAGDVRSPWDAAGALFKCLSAPLRIGIIQLLDEQPRTVSELVDLLGVPQPLVSQHLRVLRDQCLINGERHGRATTYSLMDDHVAHIVRDAIQHVGEHDPALPKDRHHSQKDLS